MAYYGTALPISLIQGNKELLRTPHFWIKSAAFIILIGLFTGYYLFPGWVQSLSDPSELIFAYWVSNYLKGFVIFIVPIFIIKHLFDKSQTSAYGLAFRKFNYKPYLTILLIVLPFIIIASFQPDFQMKYPMFKPWTVNSAFGFNRLAMGTIFELLYGISFVFIEWVFRGALVLGLVSVMGKGVILPMVASYAFLHFGKPPLEAISSIFGGYILGIISLRTKSIMGGTVIHVGIAWAMDLCAYLQHYFK
ncbi:CPBP family intramembrane metalloprotease [Fulvivirgaceae bacterium BMA10]|uniref:CPBP family intramembrane metalloprotease n=1 Tax=Splendidivirga corallicola TaxID=3051826 RepID=A0ABT8KRI4_9BACT|nr:CPBP family intramembrane metalloprotease [Fulvivirgaceae bacterium BMA10]